MVTAWPASAALYRGLVTHNRREPLRYRLRHRTYWWFVDVDQPPRPRWPLRALVRFDDQTGNAGASIRADIESFLLDSDEPVPGGAIRMLCHARSLGHVFNPLTVYWCHDRDGALIYVIAEVHNTYGGRHRYLLRPGDGAMTTPKQFYVSPFNPVRGRYRLRLPEPGSRLRLSITYELDGETIFAAAVAGRRSAATTANLLRACLRHPFSTLAVSAAIRWHGVRLYLRGLPVVPRCEAAKEVVSQGGRHDD